MKILIDIFAIFGLFCLCSIIGHYALRHEILETQDSHDQERLVYYISKADRAAGLEDELHKSRIEIVMLNMKVIKMRQALLFYANPIHWLTPENTDDLNNTIVSRDLQHGFGGKKASDALKETSDISVDGDDDYDGI